MAFTPGLQYRKSKVNQDTSSGSGGGGGSKEQTVPVNPDTLLFDPNSTYRIPESQVRTLIDIPGEKTVPVNPNTLLFDPNSTYRVSESQVRTSTTSDTQKIGGSSGNRFVTTNGKIGYASSGVTEIRQGGRGQGGFVVATNKPIVNVSSGFARKVLSERRNDNVVSNDKVDNGFTTKEVVLSVKQREQGSPPQSIDFLYSRPKNKGDKNVSRNNSNNLLGSNNNNNNVLPIQKTQREKSSFEKRVEGIDERRQRFSQTNYFNFANKATDVIYSGTKNLFNKKNLIAPTLQRDLFLNTDSFATGSGSEKVSKNVIKGGFLLGPGMIMIGENIAATGEGLYKNPKDTGRELFVYAPKRLEQSSFSFLPLPGGTPINEEGATTLVMIAGGALISRSSLKSSSPIQVETTNLVVKGEPEILLNDIGSLKVKTDYRNKPLLKADEFVVESGTRTVKSTSVGLDFGSRGIPIVSKVGSEILPFNKGLKNKIPLTDLRENLNQPLTASGGKVLRNQVLDLSPTQRSRVESAIVASRNLGIERGLPVKDFVLNIEGLRNPKGTTEIFQGFLKENKNSGKVFGSLVTKTLPEGYQSTKIGDIDLMFPKLTVEEIRPKLVKFTEQLQKGGEDVFYKEDNTILFRSGEKLLEAKSGVNQDVLGLGDEAPAGYLGFKTGTSSKRSFGEGSSIQIGEQLRNKGSGALIINAGGVGETPSFSGFDIIGKNTGGNVRGLKDVAGFIQTGKGIAEIKSNKFNPLENLRAKRGSQAVDKYFESFTTEQRFDVLNKLQDITGSDFKIELINKRRLSDVDSNFRSVGLKSQVSNTGSDVGLISKSVVGSGSSGRSGRSGVSNVLNVGSVLSSVGSSKSNVGSDFSLSKYSSPRSASPSRSVSSKSPYSFTSPSLFGYSSPSPSLSRSGYSSSSLSPSSYGFKAGSERSPSLVGSPYFRSGKGLFSVDVRSKGKFFTVGEGLNLKDAVKLGQNITGGSSARSFKIRSKSGSNKPLTGLDVGGRYYQKNGVFIEKSKYAINTGGELSQITFKGVNAQRRKNIGVF